MRFLVQHHPSRERQLLRLLESLDVEPTVVLDPDPDSPVKSAWRTYRACLIEAGDDPAVILQDDAVCCPGFSLAAATAHEARPEQLIGFFHGARTILRPHPTGPLLDVTYSRWVPTVALLWPEGAAAEFLHWADHVRHVRPDFLGDDSVVKLWLDTSWRGLTVTIPSLVEHPDDGPSLVRARHPGGRAFRKAAAYVGDGVDSWIASVVAS